MIAIDFTGSHRKFFEIILSAYGAAGRRWLDDLPQLVDEIAEKWSLTIEKPFPNLSYNFVVPCIRSDGTQAVLKIAFCFENSEIFDEYKLLKYLDGRGAVRVFDLDENRCAMLLERLTPGENLFQLCANEPERATEIAVETLKRFQQPAAPNCNFPLLEKWTNGFARAENTEFPKMIVKKVRGIYEELNGTAAKYLLHGDFHHENILSATREPFLLIDPKGIVGGIGYDIAVFLNNLVRWQLSAPDVDSKIKNAVEKFGEVFEIEPSKLRKWAYAQMVLSALWTFEDRTGKWREELDFAEIWKV
ncbi:MAG TPA: aminoglycoside phosphotransferase family protein [Pyrinomonadaceae bacterium]|jgi:streptomycin 6-kinase